MVITSLKDLFDFSYVGCSLLTSMHVSLLGYVEMFTVLMQSFQFGDFIASLFHICGPLYENLCFVTVCYFVNYTWDC